MLRNRGSKPISVCGSTWKTSKCVKTTVVPSLDPLFSTLITSTTQILQVQLTIHSNSVGTPAMASESTSRRVKPAPRATTTTFTASS